MLSRWDPLKNPPKTTKVKVLRPLRMTDFLAKKAESMLATIANGMRKKDVL